MSGLNPIRMSGINPAETNQERTPSPQPIITNGTTPVTPPTIPPGIGVPSSFSTPLPKIALFPSSTPSRAFAGRQVSSALGQCPPTPGAEVANAQFSGTLTNQERTPSLQPVAQTIGNKMFTPVTPSSLPRGIGVPSSSSTSLPEMALFSSSIPQRAIAGRQVSSTLGQCPPIPGAEVANTQFSRTSAQCPPTPAMSRVGSKRGRSDDIMRANEIKRRRIEDLQSKIPYLKEAVQVAARMSQSNFSPFTVTIGDRKIEITERLEKLGEGGYFTAYKVKGKGLENEIFVLKVLQNKHLDNPEKACKALRNEFKNSQKVMQVLTQHNLEHHIARHFDFEIAIAQGKGERDPMEALSHGCYLVEYIPNPLPKDFRRSELFPEGSEERRIDDQLKMLIKVSYDNSLPLDLTAQNTGLLKDVKVLDPWVPQDGEHHFMGKGVERSLKSFALHACFKGEEDSPRFKHLDPRPKV